MTPRKVRIASRIPQLPRDTGDGVARYQEDLNRALGEWFNEYQQYMNLLLAQTGPNLPSFAVNRNNVNQVGVVSGAVTIVQFNTAAFDTHSCFDLTTNFRYTVKVPGVYLFGALMRFNYAPGAADFHTIQIFKNGAAVVNDRTEFPAALAALASLRVQTLVKMGIGDYLDFRASQNSGVNKDINGTAAITNAWGSKIGEY